MSTVLVISDIHGNYPTLQALASAVDLSEVDWVINCGDSLVYGPFPNETLQWLKANGVLSILGNTDRKVKRLLQGRKMTKPSNPEKRIMYETTAAALDLEGQEYLFSLKKKRRVVIPRDIDDTHLPPMTIGVFHGSPDDPDEFLFADTAPERFIELAANSRDPIVVCGHSHSPFHHHRGGVHFINPGSLGRMFDSDPRGSCAMLRITGKEVTVRHLRIAYDINRTLSELQRLGLPEIYGKMYTLGRKLN